MVILNFFSRLFLGSHSGRQNSVKIFVNPNYSNCFFFFQVEILFMRNLLGLLMIPTLNNFMDLFEERSWVHRPKTWQKMLKLKLFQINFGKLSQGRLS